MLRDYEQKIVDAAREALREHSGWEKVPNMMIVDALRETADELEKDSAPMPFAGTIELIDEDQPEGGDDPPSP